MGSRPGPLPPPPPPGAASDKEPLPAPLGLQGLGLRAHRHSPIPVGRVLSPGCPGSCGAVLEKPPLTHGPGSSPAHWVRVQEALGGHSP